MALQTREIRAKMVTAKRLRVNGPWNPYRSLAAHTGLRRETLLVNHTLADSYLHNFNRLCPKGQA